MASASSSSATGEGAPRSQLPDEVVECVLSFLPLPTLCRLRIVCKDWNNLLSGPSFHDRCHEVIFLTRFQLTAHGPGPLYRKLDPRVQTTTCFLDLAERRWYSITHSRDCKLDMRQLSVADGLVAVSWCEDDDNNCRVKILNPFMDLTRILEPPFFVWHDSPLPTLVTDHLSRIFLMDNSGRGTNDRTQFLWIHESGGWHPARHPPNPQFRKRLTPEKSKITTAWSAVVFRGDLYAILSPGDSHLCFLMKYDCEKDTWTTIREDAPNPSAERQLLVSGDRLFMRFWRSGPTLHSSRLLEIVEIVENASRIVLQVPSATLERFFGEPAHDLACVVPRGVSSDGSCRAVVLVSGSSGRVVVYDVVNRSSDVLPAHPLGEAQVQRSSPRMWYWATNTKLSCKDFLPPIRP